jgi:hypothetical protein
MSENISNLVYIKNNLYCLNDIVNNIIKSKNAQMYMKDVKDKENIDGNYYIKKDDMVLLLNKSKSPSAKQYLDSIKV